MAGGSVPGLLKIPGRLVVNPTTSFATTSYPYGGTEIGRANQCALQSFGTPFPVWYESLGRAGDILSGDIRFVFSCFLRGWDDDAIELMLSKGYAEGSTTRHSQYSEPAEVPGQTILGRGVRLVYVPDDTVHAPALIIYHGIVEFQESAPVSWQRSAEHGLPVTVECLDDADYDAAPKIWKAGRLADLAVT